MPREPGCARLIFATWPGGENSTREHFLREKKDRRKFPDLRYFTNYMEYG